MVVSSGVRPYNYEAQNPLRLSIGDITGFSGIIFSEAAFSMLHDLRLFNNLNTTTPFKAYINKDANRIIIIEPDASGDAYIDNSGCVHYIDYIKDLRESISGVFAAHAADSAHAAFAFEQHHLRKQHSLFPAKVSNISNFIHHLPSVGVLPSGEELGTSGIFDIDIAEIQWQPTVRPSALKKTTFGPGATNIPLAPLFPFVITVDGTSPLANTDDVNLADDLAIDVFSSGAFLLTGDVIIDGSEVILMTSSGATPSATSTYQTNVDGALYPTHAGQNVTTLTTPSGRQVIFDTFTLSTTLEEGVYLLGIDTTPSTSGNISTFPANYASISGFTNDSIWDSEGKLLQPLPEGVYVADKLIFKLSPGGEGSAGRSRITGRKAYSHIIDNTRNINNKAFAGLVYQDVDGTPAAIVDTYNQFVDTLLGFGVPRECGGTHNPVLDVKSTVTHAELDQTLSNVAFIDVQESFRRDRNFFESAAAGNITNFGQGVARVFHNIWTPGASKFMITSNRNGAARNTLRSYRYEVQKFIEPSGPVIVVCTTDSFFPASDNIFHDIDGLWNFARTKNGRLVNVGGNIYVNYSGNRFFKLGVSYRDAPASLTPTPWRYQPGFGYWRIKPISQETNIPSRITNAGGASIILPEYLPFSNSDVVSSNYLGSPLGQGWGPVVYDFANDLNYFYIELKQTFIGHRYWFCTMTNDFQVIKAVPVDSDDLLITANIGILTL